MVSSNTAKVVRNSECSLRICSSVTSVFSYSSGSLSDMKSLDRWSSIFRYFLLPSMWLPSF